MNLNYNIIYSKRKKLQITVERDRSIIVHSPLGVSEERIKILVDSKRQWLFEKTNHSQKYLSLPHPPGKELVNGESMMYLGKNYKINLVKSDTNEIHFAHNFQVPEQLASDGIACFKPWYKQRAKEKILTRVKLHADNLGVKYQELKITESRYQWGSCTPSNNLNINWKLIKAPIYVIDYVIVHELAHLLEENHTQRFWRIVETKQPLMDKAKKWLREHGQILEDSI